MGRALMTTGLPAMLAALWLPLASRAVGPRLPPPAGCAVLFFAVASVPGIANVEHEAPLPRREWRAERCPAAWH